MISCTIMACREREPLVDELLDSLDGPAKVVWDTDRDRWHTGKAALLSYDPRTSHHVVLQDDAVVCRDLLASVAEAVKVVADKPISLFYSHGSNAPHQRMNRVARAAVLPTWLEFEGPWWGVAVVFPTKLIDKMVRLADAPQATPAYDKRLSRALVKMKVNCRYVLPSLVDHRIDGPSMIEGREQEERHAWHFIGKDASALGIPWDSMPVVDARRNKRLAPVIRQPTNAVPALRPRPKAHDGEVKVSFAVMAHPSRQEMVKTITSKVDATVVVWDELGDRWHTGSRAMSSYASDATHMCVIQDDAIVCDELEEGLTKALEVVPDNPVGLYLGNIRPAPGIMGAMTAHAERNSLSWVVGEGPLWGVGVVLPVSMIGPMLQGCAASSIEAYDRRMAAWFKSQGIWCWYTMPSLVDHRAGPSLVHGQRAPTRHARRFLEGSAAEVDWSKLPADTSDPYVSYTGPGTRRYHMCLSCGYYTPVLHSVRRHVRVEHGLDPQVERNRQAVAL